MVMENIPDMPEANEPAMELSVGDTQATSSIGADVENGSPNWNIDLLLDVELPIAVSFGEAEMPLKDILKLGVGSVIELDKSLNDPVTVIVNRKPIARGEVVMVDGNYGVRILEVESTADRIRSLG
jgi:flagellar motor switch protein FliN